MTKRGGHRLGRIGDLARATGLTVRTLRHYESVGLLPAPSRTEGKQRLYTAQDVSRLYRIRALRDLGLGLAEIRRLLVLRWLVSQGRSMIASNSILRNKCKELLPSGEERESSATEDAGGSATPPLEVLRAAVGGLDAHGVFRLRSQETKPAPEQGAGEDAGDDA